MLKAEILVLYHQCKGWCDPIEVLLKGSDCAWSFGRHHKVAVMRRFA